MSEQNQSETPEQKQGEVPWWRTDPWMGHHKYLENRNKNCDLLLQYPDMIVAWFPDGSGIRDADKDRDALRERIKASGDDPDWYHYEYVHTMAHV